MKRLMYFLPTLFFLCFFIKMSAQVKNSYDLVQSVSDLISHNMEDYQSTLKPEKVKEYKTDLERLSDLPSKKQQEIYTFIFSITTPVNDPIVSEDEIAIFCKNIKTKEDLCVFAFLDGKCVGVGTLTKGLFTNMPKEKHEQGIQTLTLYSCGSKLVNVFSSPINFSLKNYYKFRYDKKGYVLFN